MAFWGDFKGKKISTEVKPFAFRGAVDALKARCREILKEDYNFTNGTVAAFQEVDVFLDESKQLIRVTATVEYCEPDCG